MKTTNLSKYFLSILCILFELVLVNNDLHAQTTQTFSSSGTFTVPAGVTTLQIECWGGGGGGGGSSANNSAGGGGGGGAYAKNTTVTVTPGNTYTVTVGTAGAAGAAAGGTGGAGLSSSFNTSSVIATGGAGGIGATVAATGGAGGAGGTGSTGVTVFSGGAGAAGIGSGTSGGGGSSAGTASNGNNGSGATGGTAVTGGGAGGNGGASNAAGSAGSVPGGGGGGGRRTATTNRAGGAGAAGQVKITYTLPACSGTPAASNIISSANPACSGANFTLSLSTSYSALTGITYQWQQSTVSSSGPWTNLGTAATQVTSSTATRWYQCVITCANGGGVTNSAVLTESITPLPVVAVTPGAATFCTGNSGVVLTATGATTYVWSPVTNLVPSAGTSAVETSSPTATRTYTVTGTTSGCSGSTTVTVTNGGAAPTVPTVTATPSAICLNGSSTLSASNTVVPSISAYVFSQSTTAYTPVSGGTILGSGSQDDDTYAPVSIGFNFIYHGVTFSTIGADDNGIAVLGAASPGFEYGVALQDVVNCIAPMNYDLLGDAGAHQLRYRTTGTPGSQVFTLEWFNWGFFDNSGASEFNMQIQLFEGTNVIRFVYQPTSPATTESTQVGLTGAAVSDFNGRRSNTSWTATNALANNTQTLTFSSSVFPSNGLTFTFTPPTVNFTYTWSPATFLNTTSGSTVVATNVSSTTIYTVSASNGTCASIGTTTLSTGSPVTAAPTAALFPATYGVSTATDDFDDEIRSVTFGTLVQASTCNQTGTGPSSVLNLYSDYTTGAGAPAAPNIAAGTSASLIVRLAFCDGSNFTTSCIAYIDFNHNGSFTDAGESIIVASSVLPAVNGTNYTVSFPIPSGAISGITRLRVVDVEGDISGVAPTGTYSWGETEDYNINITGGSNPCGGTAFQLSANASGGGTPYTYSWAPSTGLSSTTVANPVASPNSSTTYSVTVHDLCGTVGTGTVAVNVVTAPNVTVTPAIANFCVGGSTTLTASGATTYTWSPATNLNTTSGAVVIANPSVPTTYTVSGTNGGACPGLATATVTVYSYPVLSSVVASPSAVLSGGSSTLTATLAGPAAYCVPFNSSDCQAEDEITNVTFAGINRTSACDGGVGGANYFPSPAGNVIAGQIYTLSVSTGTGNITDDGVSIWIDYNQDGVFSGSELIYTSYSGADPATYTVSVTIPMSALNGNTRMRVRNDFGQAPTSPCTNQTYGETEDYEINVTGGVSPLLTYSWSPATFLTSSTTNPAIATGITSTTIYTVTVTNGGGCSVSGSDTVEVSTMVYDHTSITQVTSPTCTSPGALNVPILKMVVYTAGLAGNINMDGFQVDLGGTTNPQWVSNARIYYTGNSPVFATTTPYAIELSAGASHGYGSFFMTPSGGVFPIGSIAGNSLTPHYFWLAYDVYSGSSACGGTLDGQVTYVQADDDNAEDNDVASQMPAAGSTSVSIADNFAPSGSSISTCGGTLLSWNRACGYTGNYDVYLNGALIASNLNSTHATTPDLTPSTSYTWQIMNAGSAYIPGCNLQTFQTASVIAPAAHISVISGPSSGVCGNSFTFSASSFNDAMQWQSSSDNVTFSNISGYTSATAVISPPGPGTYYYRAYAIASGLCASDTVYSNVLTLVLNAPTVTISTSNSTICPGGLSTLTANGPAPYAWSNGATSQSIVVSPAATTNYTVTAGTLPVSPNPYCVPGYTTGCGFPDVISDVTFGPLNNSTGIACGEGANLGVDPLFTSPNPTYIAGNAYALSVTTDGDDEGVAIWIDYNQDGLFSASELLNHGFAGTTPATYSSSVVIPANAINGTTRMRVRCTFFADPTTLGSDPSCLSVTYGETEDYVITIAGGANLTGGCYATASATVVVGGPVAAPSATNATSAATICPGTSVTLDAGPVTGVLGGPVTYSWSSGGCGASPSCVVTPSVSTTYTLTITDGVCPHIYTVPVSIFVPPTASLINNGPVCNGATAVLTASGTTTAPPIVAGTNYIVSSIPFAPQSNTGTALVLGDEELSAAVPVGFTFNFYGINYSQVYVGSNGFITFNGASDVGCCQGDLLPNNSTFVDNLIALDWEDLDPTVGGNIRYNTTGSVGSRIFRVTYTNIRHYPSGNSITGQILLYEGYNRIELHLTNVHTDNDGTEETQGVEDVGGIHATTVAGRNATDPWTATNEAWSFVLPPAVNFNYSWAPGSSPNTATNSVTPSGTTVYTVTLTDSHGCSASANTTVNVVLPTISCPADITVCNSTGFCSYSGSIGSATAGAQPCTNTITHTPLAPYGLGDNLITWTVTDQFGNTASCVQKVTVNDCQAPVITCPANTVVSCNGGDTSVGTNGTATAADNCGGSVAITSSDVIVAGSCTANYDIQRTWSASDALGNTSTCVQTIQVRDLVAPVIGGLCFNQTLECPDVPVLCAAYASDDCSTFTLSFADVTTPTCGNSYVITRTYTATDACGNVSTAVETATVEDITAPVIDNVGPLQVVMCPATPAFSTPTASDECSTAALTYYDETITFCTGSYAVTRHYTATDPCGNSSTADEMIIVLDFSAPTISGVGSDMTIECPASPAWSNPTSADGCSNSTLTFDDVTTGGCGGSYSTTRTWTATDDCFNSSSLSQTISVEDHTAPTILNVNANSTIECPASPNFGVAVATDACSNFSLTSNDVTTAGCGSSYSTTRTWTATDDCGNTSTASETISVEDHTGPVISGVGADQAIECPQAPVFSAPAAADACGSSTMTFADATTNGCGGSYTTTRTWTAVDGCGNTTTAQQTIHVEDHTGPVISGVGANQVIECPATPVFSNPTQSDACSSSSMAFATVTTNGCGTTYTKVRTWTATDACGNVTTASQTISVQDHTNPVISGVNPGQTIQCPATPNFCSPTASDVCNSVVLTYADVNVAHCGGTYTRTRTWTAIDACGNTTTASQAINVIDNVAPVITGISPAVLIIQCPATPVFGTGIAADACSSTGMTLTFNDVTTALCGGAYTKTRTWTATDGCGNVRTGSQTVNVIDNTAPVITGVAANATIACPSSPTWSTPTSTDACGTSAITYADVTTTICGGSYSRTRTWTATDACGNHSSASRTVTVSDLTPPVISGVGANQTIQCPATPVYSNPIATDACGSATIAFNDVTATICGSSYSRTRTWTATDACGNHSTASQTITVQDITAPVLSNLGSNATIQCPASPVWNTPIATDACGSSTVTFSDVTVNGCGSSYTRTRTWTATDGCGNASTASRTITVQDNTAPVISGVGAAATINCPATPSFSTATAADACGTSTLTSNDVTVNGTCPGNYTTTRTWTATDGCGNTSTASQAITVHDVTPPTISCPATIYLCASALSPALTNATGSDGCSSVAISHSVCPANFPTGTTVITWTATDLCGNTATCTQNVIRDAAITVSIAHSGDISGYCQGNNAATLTANAAGGTGTLSYLWSNGATTQSISVSSTGTYTVVVTDQFAAPCSGTASYVFQTNSTSALSSYTILAKDNVHLHGYNTVQNGGVGAATTTGSAEGGGAGWVKIHDHSTLNATTTFARAAGIQVDGTSMVMNQVLSASNAAMPAFDAGLPASNTNVTVPAFTTVTLNGTVYGDITVGQGATLIFGHATVDLKNLYVGQGATVQFTQSCTKLRMASQLDIDRNAVFNPDADGKDVAVYLKHINNSGSGAGSANYSFGYGSGGGALTSVNVEYGASVKAFIYAPDGKIDVHGGASGLSATNGNTSSAFSSSSTTTMKGLFIARAVKAHGRTNWNWNTVCSSCNYSLRNSEDDAAQTLRSEELNSGMLIENFPDPFMDKTSIRFVMEKDTHATVKVYDISGKYISTIFEGDVRAKKEYRMEFDGSSLASGMYIYKVITPEDVHTGKMMLIKE